MWNQFVIMLIFGKLLYIDLSTTNDSSMLTAIFHTGTNETLTVIRLFHSYCMNCLYWVKCTGLELESGYCISSGQSLQTESKSWGRHKLGIGSRRFIPFWKWFPIAILATVLSSIWALSVRSSWVIGLGWIDIDKRPTKFKSIPFGSTFHNVRLWMGGVSASVNGESFQR
jgi:hypothetical protein